MSDHRNRESLLLPILLPLGVLATIALVLFGFSRVLLGVTPTAATVVACITAMAVVGVAAFAASRERLTAAALFPMVGSIAGIALLAGGVALVAVGSQEEGGGEGPAPIAAAVAAPPGAATKGFDPTKLTFTAGTPTDLEFDNEDPSVQHNVVIFEGKDDSGTQVFRGELVTGPSTVPYSVPALSGGAYFFHCEVHPTTMTGSIDVAEAAGGGAGGGLAIAAANLQFDTNTLEMPADTPTPLAFDNQDAGTLHNVAVFKDEAYTESILTGDQIMGPAQTVYNLPALAAGTYYFRCDVHPTTMQGTLVVSGGAGGGGSGGGAGDGASPSPPASPSSA